MTGRSMKFDPEAWLRDDVEAEWALTRDRQQAAALPGGTARETKRGIAASEQSGIDAIINAGFVSERLPMLDVVFDRLVRLMTASLRSLTSDTIEVSIEAVSSVRFGAFLNDMPLPSLIGVAHAHEWDNSALLVVRPELAFAVVDVLLGGRRGVPPAHIGRPGFTAIETKLVERLIGVVLSALGEAFAPLAQVGFTLDRIETNPRFAGIARPTSAAVNARFRIEMDERGGLVDLVIPHATLEPIRALLLQRFTGETLGRDSLWERHLVSELHRASVDVEAVLGEQQMTLADIMAFKPGQTLLFGTREDQPITLRCGGRTVGHGQMGRSGHQLAVRLTDRDTDKPGKAFRLRGED
ncbi:flagellar motor switch protein FliM [Sphingosinicella soli]|uniref:Flagellar motor switch protein FliM n=1 Tax=Sphingosinicella soli TaxID=333708 RepID=A0A7W7B1G5_9SPHN|nr:flagellar motor switch protein FliM [Sphingosinicella soli]MBB4632144.1 flagellar motor switch protein FliM [Sphingosinicella soli]